MAEVVDLELMLLSVRGEIKRILQFLDIPESQEYLAMLNHHFGFSKRPDHVNIGGKMIRPLILLLCFNHIGEKDHWKAAVPAAAAIELLHNFSLIHDDIQDSSPIRRNQDTVWKIWGVPQAINAGDGVFALANIALGNLEGSFPPETLLRVIKLFNQTCLDLTRGQNLDIAFEQKSHILLEDYWRMIEYKTARLIATSAEIGAVLAGFLDDEITEFRKYGTNVGLAFQVLDDILGIWGDESKTGKSSTKDLEDKKNSLPILLGLQKSQEFVNRWKKGNISRAEAKNLALLLENSGIKSEVQNQAELLTTNALNSLKRLPLNPSSKSELYKLTNDLLNRQT